MRLLSRVILSSLILAWALSVPVLAQDAVTAQQRLPDNTQVFLRLSSVENLKERWQGSSMGSLVDDDEFQGIRDELGDRYEDLSRLVKDELEVSLDDLLSMPSGEIALGVFPNRDQSMGFVVFVDFGESQETVEILIEKAEERLEDSEGERSSEEIDGTRVTRYAFGTEDEVVFCIRDEHLIIANGVSPVETILSRWDGESSRCLAATEVFQYIMEKCQSSHDEPLFQYYLDPIGLVTSSIAASGEGNLQAQMVLGFLPSLGLNKLVAIGGATDIATEKYDSVNRALIYVDGPATGVLNVFRFPAADLEPPEWVPANSQTFASMNWDVQGAYAAIEALVDMFQGAGALKKIVDRIADEPNGPKLHLKNDIVDLLSGRLQFFQDLSDAEDPQSARVAMALGLIDDESRMEAVLRRFADTPGFPGEVREFRGVNIYELDTTGQFGAKVGAATTRGNLFIVSDVTLLDQIIRGDIDPLKDDDGWQEVRRQLPDQMSVLAFQRQDPQQRLAYEALRQSGDANGLVPGFNLPPVLKSLEAQLKELPPYEVLEKYLVPTTSYAIPDERGVFLMQFGLRSDN